MWANPMAKNLKLKHLRSVLISTVNYFELSGWPRDAVYSVVRDHGISPRNVFDLPNLVSFIDLVDKINIGKKLNRNFNSYSYFNLVVRVPLCVIMSQNEIQYSITDALNFFIFTWAVYYVYYILCCFYMFTYISSIMN